MKQQTLAMAADQGAGFEQYRRRTKREDFLDAMPADGARGRGHQRALDIIPAQFFVQRRILIRRDPAISGPLSGVCVLELPAIGPAPFCGVNRPGIRGGHLV